MEKRLRPKYRVYKVDEGGATIGDYMQSTDPEDVDSPFVLMPRKDPAAMAAMAVYARMCEPVLANEISTWLRKIAEAEPVYGTQGIRNLKTMRFRAVSDIFIRED